MVSSCVHVSQSTDTPYLIGMYAYIGGRTYLKGLTDAKDLEQPTKNINFVTEGIT